MVAADFSALTRMDSCSCSSISRENTSTSSALVVSSPKLVAASASFNAAERRTMGSVSVNCLRYASASSLAKSSAFHVLSLSPEVYDVCASFLQPLQPV